MDPPSKHNIVEWLDQNEKFLEPPVMNKLMYGDGQLKVMFVGGPNIRSDYHLEAGEELFYMHRGNMVVKVIEHGKFVDVPIEEGELFLLPGRIPHSPQRFTNTIGLVIERERELHETDCLRWHVPDQEVPESLYEEFFHCHDLGVQLKPVIEAFFASEQKKTGKPLPGTIIDTEKAPITPNPHTSLPPKIPLKSWLAENAPSIASSVHGVAPISDSGEFKVLCYAGTASNPQVHCYTHGEAWIWQWAGSTSVSLESDTSFQTASADLSSSQLPRITTQLNPMDCYLIQTGVPFKMAHSPDSITLVILMIPHTNSTA